MAEERISHKEAQAREAALLGGYGLDEESALKLIKDARKQGGIDGLLRDLARKENS